MLFSLASVGFYEHIEKITSDELHPVGTTPAFTRAGAVVSVYWVNVSPRVQTLSLGGRRSGPHLEEPHSRCWSCARTSICQHKVNPIYDLPAFFVFVLFWFFLLFFFFLLLKIFFFGCGPFFFKPLVNLLQYCFCFMFFGH